MKIFFFAIISTSVFLFSTYLIPFKKRKIFLLFTIFLFTLTLCIYFFKSDLGIIDYQKKIESDLKESEEIDPKKLISFLEFKLSKEPKDLDGWLILSRTCLISGYIQKADLYYKKSISHFPENLDLLKEVAQFNIKNGQPKEAINFLLKIKKLEPENNDNNIMLSNTFIIVKDFDMAKKEFKELNKEKVDIDILYGIEAMLNKN